MWGCHGAKVRVMDGEVGPEVCAVGQRADQRYQGCHSCRAFPCTPDQHNWCMDDDRLILIDSNLEPVKPRMQAEAVL